MSQLNLSWGIESLPGGNHDHPSWLDVENKLNQLCQDNGSVGLSILNAPSIGPQTLSVHANHGRYLLMLGELDGQDHHVRTFENKIDVRDPAMIEIGGYFWDERSICQDFDVVKRAFLEFFLKGDVSDNLLS